MYVHILGELYQQAVVEQSEPATDYCIQCCNRTLTKSVVDNHYCFRMQTRLLP